MSGPSIITVRSMDELMSKYGSTFSIRKSDENSTITSGTVFELASTVRELSDYAWQKKESKEDRSDLSTTLFCGAIDLFNHASHKNRVSCLLDDRYG